jgi:signal transduction histidine kinase
LYVAELNLQTIGGHGPERAHVATVIERIDDAIEGLREAIAELKTPNDQTDIAAALRSITDTVPTRMQVHLSVRGAREHLPARAARQLLAVAQEAVSNAVRHAAANQLGVDLELDADTLTLTVTDDGVGIGAAARPTSGMLNIRERAEQLGGHCRWQPNPPHGTAMVWQVPLLPPAQLAVVASRQASPIQPSGPTPQPTGSSVEVIVDE